MIKGEQFSKIDVCNPFANQAANRFCAENRKRVWLAQAIEK
jgi:hypothetical protein